MRKKAKETQRHSSEEDIRIEVAALSYYSSKLQQDRLIPVSETPEQEFVNICHFCLSNKNMTSFSSGMTSGKEQAINPECEAHMECELQVQG